MSAQPSDQIDNAFVDRGLMEYDVINGYWGDAGESIESYHAVIDQVRQRGANRDGKADKSP